MQTQTTTWSWVQRTYKLKNRSGRNTTCKEGSRNTRLDGEGKAGMQWRWEKEASGEKWHEANVAQSCYFSWTCYWVVSKTTWWGVAWYLFCLVTYLNCGDFSWGKNEGCIFDPEMFHFRKVYRKIKSAWKQYCTSYLYSGQYRISVRRHMLHKMYWETYIATFIHHGIFPLASFKLEKVERRFQMYIACRNTVQQSLAEFLVHC